MFQRNEKKLSPFDSQKYSFDSTPQLVHPEFNVPIIRMEEDLSQIEFSDRIENSDIDRFNRNINPTNNQNTQNTHLESDKKTTIISEISPLHKKNSFHTVSFVINENQDLEESNIHIQNTFSHLDLQSDTTFKGTTQNINQNLSQSIIGQKSNVLTSRLGGVHSNNNFGKRQSRYFTLGEGDKTRLTSTASKEEQIMEGTIPLLKNHGSQKFLFEHISKSTKRVLAIAASFVFYEKLRKLTGIRVREVCQRNENVKAEQMRLLNSMASLKDKKIPKDYLTKKMKITPKENNNALVHCLQNIPVVHPNSGKLLSWDISIFIFTILSITYIPIESVINTNFQEVYGQKWNYFLWASVSVFLIQIALQTNMGYYDKGQCIMERNRIWKRYFQLGFWLDVLSSFPIFMSVVGMNGYIAIFNLLVLLKVQQVDRFFQKYFEICTLRRRLYATTFLKFFYLLLKILFFGHCFACIFLAMAYHVQEHKTWVTKYGQGLPESGWFTKYVYAFYWGVTTMTTVGLGDLIPANIYETVVLSCFMFVSCGTFAYMFNSIGVVLGELNQKHDQFTEEMRLVSRYLSMKNVSHDLQLEVRKFIEYKFDFENEISTEEEHKVFSKLSQPLQEKLVISTNMIILQQCHFLSKNFSEEFLLKLCLSMKSESKLNQESIYHQDEVQSEHLDDIKFYILENGLVRLFVNTNEAQKDQQQIFIQNISEWQYFGAVEFFTDEPRHFSAVAVGSTKLLSIKRKQFLALLKSFPVDFEKFCMIRDSAKINKNFSSLKIECSVCSSIDHCVKYCSNLHFNPDRELSILKNTFSVNQRRDQGFMRNQRMKINCLFEMQIIQDRAIHFQQDDSNNESQEYAYFPSPYERNSITGLENSITSPTKEQVFFNPKSFGLIPDQNANNKESDQFDRQNFQFKLKPRGQESALVVHSGMKGQIQRAGGRQVTIKLQVGDADKVNNNYGTGGGGGQNTIPSINYIDGQLSPLRYKYPNGKNNIINADIDFPQKKVASQTQIQLEKVEFSIIDFEKGQIFKTYFEHNNLDVILANHEQVKLFLRKLIEASKTQYFLFPRKFKANLNIKDSSQAKHDLTFMENHHSESRFIGKMTDFH